MGNVRSALYENGMYFYSAVAFMCGFGRSELFAESAQHLVGIRNSPASRNQRMPTNERRGHLTGLPLNQARTCHAQVGLPICFLVRSDGIPSRDWTGRVSEASTAHAKECASKEAIKR